MLQSDSPWIRALVGILLTVVVGCGPTDQGPANPANHLPEAGTARDDPNAQADANPGNPRGEPSGTVPPNVAALDLETMSVLELLKLLESVEALDDRRAILETVIRKDPGHRRALIMLMEVTERLGVDLALQEGRREESKPLLNRAAEVARSIRQLDAPLSPEEQQYMAMVFYNEACNFALDDEPDRAIDSLRAAFELGFSHAIIFEDEELNTLRGREDFQALLNQYAPQIAETPEETSST